MVIKKFTMCGFRYSTKIYKKNAEKRKIIDLIQNREIPRSILIAKQEAFLTER